MSDEYAAMLREVLSIPSIEEEGLGARGVVRCLFKPSFHPECVVSLIEGADGDTVLTVRAPHRSVWSHYSALHLRSRVVLVGGSSSPSALAEAQRQHGLRVAEASVVPEVSIERVPLPGAAVDGLGERVRGADREPEPPEPILDGMSVVIELRRNGVDRTISSHASTLLPAHTALLRWLIALARAHVATPTSKAALDSVEPYLSR